VVASIAVPDGHGGCTLQIDSSTNVRERTPFIGRARERALLLNDLAKGAGLLMLTGPSGIGKTRLARQVAGELVASSEAKADIFFCSISGCQSAADLEAAVAAVLGLPPTHGEELARAIASRGPTLLILDNIDSVASQIGEVLGGWLDLCVELQMLATSIVPIGLLGEVRVEVGPLEAQDAIELYLERAHRAWAGRTFTEAEAEVVAELVGRLDRIPLAIELAAARVRVLPPRTLLSRFGERFELLRTSTPGRQGSLIQALTLTWELLDEREKTFLARASVFEGGFTYESATRILDGNASEIEVLDLLDGLRSKALLQIDESDPPRFELFESVQEYARRELHRLGGYEESVRLHSEYFVEHGERHLEDLEGERSMEAFRWIRAERGNLTAVHLRNFAGKPGLAARAGLVLAPVVLIEGHRPSESVLADSTVDAARRSGDPSLLIEALSCHASAITPAGRADEALATLEEALDLARSIGDRQEEGNLLVRKASLHVRRGEPDDAIPLLDLATRIGREERAPLIEGMALMARGSGALGRQALDEAESLYNQALELFRQHGFVRRQGMVLTWVAGVWNSQGRFREARRALQEALAVSRQMESRSYEANTLMNLGQIDLAAGLLDEAEEFSNQALSLHRQIGDRTSEGIVLGHLGVIALERGELERAERRLLEAEGILRECGVKSIHAELLPFLAVMEARRGRLKEARRSLQEAGSYFSSVGDRISLDRSALVEGILEIAEARLLEHADPAAGDALIAKARKRLADASHKELGPSGNMSTTLRLLEQDLDFWASGLRESGLQPPENSLLVGTDAGWFQLAGSPKVDLRRRVAMRRVFGALVEKRLSAPGCGTDPHELFEVGWPGLDLDPDVATKRVYLGIWALRDLGLSEVLLHQTDGYLLDPKLPLLRRHE